MYSSRDGDDIVSLMRRADELVASITDATPPDDAARIEGEHADVVRQIEAYHADNHRATVEQHGLDWRQFESLPRIERGHAILRAMREIGERNPTFGSFDITRSFDGASPGAPDPITDALVARLGGRPQTPEGERLADRSFVDIARFHLHQRGVNLQSEAPLNVVRAALGGNGGWFASRAGMHSTSDFGSVLGLAAQTRLRELYKAAETGISQIAATGTAQDFRPIAEVGLSSFPDLELVNETGEIKYGTLAETGETIRVSSFARAIGVSFQVLVNDSLDAIERSIRDIAFAAARLKSRLLIDSLAATMADGVPFFHANHANLAGSGGAPDLTTLSVARLAMIRQLAPGSDEALGIVPSILLVPPELQTAAEQIVTSITPATTNAVNPFAGKLRVVVEPRLTDPNAWYLFADPALYPSLRFLTLAGFEQPVLEEKQEFDRLGTTWRVHWHVGAAPIDYRAAYKNPGA